MIGHMRDLLAVIHGDGGQYVEAHGFERACVDAFAVVVADRARLASALIACGDVGRAYERANAETARAERASERLYLVLDPALAAMQRADDAMRYGLEECERLRERLADAEAEASRWGDAIVAIGDALGMPGAGSAEIVAAVQRGPLDGLAGLAAREAGR